MSPYDKILESTIHKNYLFDITKHLYVYMSLKFSFLEKVVFFKPSLNFVSITCYKVIASQWHTCTSRLSVCNVVSALVNSAFVHDVMNFGVKFLSTFIIDGLCSLLSSHFIW